MAPLIVSWPGGSFPTPRIVTSGGARRTRKQRAQKKRVMKRTMKRTMKRKSMKSRRRL